MQLQNKDLDDDTSTEREGDDHKRIDELAVQTMKDFKIFQVIKNSRA